MTTHTLNTHTVHISSLQDLTSILCLFYDIQNRELICMLSLLSSKGSIQTNGTHVYAKTNIFFKFFGVFAKRLSNEIFKINKCDI